MLVKQVGVEFEVKEAGLVYQATEVVADGQDRSKVADITRIIWKVSSMAWHQGRTVMSRYSHRELKEI